MWGESRSTLSAAPVERPFGRRQPAGATALDVEGVAAFSRAGKGKIAKGKSFVNVTVPGGLVASALVLVTLQNAGTGVLLWYARRISATAFTVRLNKAAATDTVFSWFVIG